MGASRLLGRSGLAICAASACAAWAYIAPPYDPAAQPGAQGHDPALLRHAWDGSEVASSRNPGVQAFPAFITEPDAKTLLRDLQVRLGTSPQRRTHPHYVSSCVLCALRGVFAACHQAVRNQPHPAHPCSYVPLPAVVPSKVSPGPCKHDAHHGETGGCVPACCSMGLRRGKPRGDNALHT